MPPPPKGQAAKRDLGAVVKAAAVRTDEMLDAISFWDTGSPGFRWNQIGAQLLVANPAPDTFRVITYLKLAIYDATIASWAWMQRFRRRRPSEHRLKTAIETPNNPSYPSDFEAGYALGKAVAAKVASATIDVDGFDTPYLGDPNAPYPGGDGSFPLTPKDEGFEIMVGEWTRS